MKRIRLLLLLSLLATTFAFGQTMQISGTIKGADDGTPIPGANITAKGTTIGTISGADGKYNITVPASTQTLVFSFVGYKPQEVLIAGKNKIDVSLEPDVVKVDEVVVVAYGTAKKGSYTGSAAQINTEKIAARPIANVLNAVEGTSPGIQVTSASGQPGSGQAIRIRGFGSISASNDPLYVVDGVPYSGTISNLNSNDIESISILKDAASSALYGNRAANGVVMITTKKGSRDRSSIQVMATQGVSTRSIPEYNRVNAFQYYPLMWESNRNSQLTFPNPTDPTLPTAAAYATANANATKNLKTLVGYNIFNVADTAIVRPSGILNPNAQYLGTYGEDLNWQTPVMRQGNRKEYGLTYSGGSDKSDYYVSIGYLNEKGYTIKSDFERYTGRINVNSQVKKWLKTGLNLSGTMTSSNVASSGGTSYVNPFFFTRNMGPIYPVYAHDPITGAYMVDPTTGGKVYDLGNLVGLPTRVAGASPGRHVVAETNYNDNLYKRNVIGANTYAEVYFLKDFKFTVNLSSNVSSYNSGRYENKIVGDGAPAGREQKINSLTTTYNINQLLNYSKTFGKHTVEVLVGHENYDYTYSYFYGFRQGQVVDGNTELINFTTTNDLYTYTDKYRTEGFLSRVNYSFDNKYLFSASFRRDGSSEFYKDNRWGNFWSVSGAWRLDQENFIKSLTFINLLKLRASYGAVGNDAGVGYYAYQALYNIGNNNANEPGFIQASIANNDISWESNNTYDGAIEFGFLNRFNGSIEFYRKVSSNLLFNVPLPVSSGITSQWRNIGEMYNQGLEFRIAADVIKMKDLRWNIDVNFSTIKNEITKMPAGQTEIISGTKKLMVGHSLYDFWLRDWYGVDPADGAGLWAANVTTSAQSANLRVVNGDSVTISQNNAKYHYAGSAIPDLLGGVTNTLSYKGFDLSILTTFQVGGKMYDGTYAALMHSGTYGTAMSVDMLRRWQKPGDVTDVPRLDNSKTTIYNVQSDRFLTDASYFAVKSVTFGYNLPKNLAQKLSLQNARIYFSGENLFLKNARKGMDPQSSFAGTTDNVYSPSRILTVGINITL